MKKIINILLAVCLMVSMLGVSALAEETTVPYPGPNTHSYPTLIDFNDEVASNGQYGSRYYSTKREPIHFYYFEGYIGAYLVSETGEPNEVEMDNWATGAADATTGIKFADFEYDSSVEKQPEKLVVSVDVKYTDINDDGKDSTEFGRAHSHIAFGSKILDTTSNSNIKENSDDETGIPWYGHGIGSNGKFVASNGDEYFFNWSQNVDIENDVITGSVYNNGVSVDATAFNNQSYKNKLNSGEYLTYTYVMDLTRDEDGKGNVIVYVDYADGENIVSEKTDTLVAREADVDKINFLTLSANRSRKFRYDNVRIYTIDNAEIAATGASVSGTDVPLTTDEVTVNFSHEITAAADEYITVKKGSEVLTLGEDYTIEHVYSTEEGTAKTAKSLKVKFNETLSYGTTYEIGASADYFGIDGYALGEETAFTTFTTEAAPQINLSNLEVSKGFFGSTTTVANLNDVIGSTANVKVTVTNAEAGAAVGTVFFGVYKNDVLVSLAFVNKTFATAETEDITANLKIPAVSEGDTVEIKAFACEGLGNLDAFGTPLSISTANQ